MAGLCGSETCKVKNPAICAGCDDVAAINRAQQQGVVINEADIVDLDVTQWVKDGKTVTAVLGKEITGFTK